MRFAGHTILITGASKGVGLACAKRFYAEGAHVALVARGQEGLDAAARGLDRNRVMTIAADVGDAEALARVVAMVVERFGGVDGLVNNAGAHFRGAFETRSATEIASMIDVNLRGPLVLSRLVLPELRTRGGFIVNVASLAGKVPLPGAATYSSTKWGLRTFTYALAEELRDTDIRVSVVSPGPIDTGFIMDNLDEVEDAALSQPMCTAEQVADLVFACAVDGRVERQWPASGGRLATLGYLVPSLRRALLPLLRARGKKVKAALRAQRGES